MSIFTVDKLGAVALPKPMPPYPRVPKSIQVVASSPVARTGAIVPVRPFVVPARVPNRLDTTPDTPEMTMQVAMAPHIPGDPNIGVPGAVIPTQNVAPLAAPPPAPERKPDPPAMKPIRVGGEVMEAKIVRRVMPAYPPLARQARIQGTVKLVGVIARDGHIINLQVEAGHPLLVAAAVDAVRQWLYKPTLLNGEPVEVIAPIDVKFTLSQ